MFREDLTPGSKKAALRTQSSLNNVQREVRQNTNGVEVTQQWQRLHNWLRMDKVGNVIAAYTSPDGINWWSCPSSTTVLLGNCFYVGVFAEGINVNSLTTVSFDVVRFIGFTQMLPLAESDGPDLANDLALDPGASLVSPLNPSQEIGSVVQTLDMFVYPNPVNSNQNITLELSGITQGNVNVSVYSMQGKLVKEFWMDAAESSVLNFNIPDATGNAYLVKAQTSDRQFVTKKVHIIRN